MDDRERIRQMLKEGKINSDQATLLVQSLKESGRRKERIFQQVIAQKTKRERKIYGFLVSWLAFILVIVSVLILIGNTYRLDRNVSKSLKEFDQASVYLEVEEYDRAITHLNKGIKYSPQFPLGYSFLGLSYRMLYEKTSDPIYREKSKQALKTAVKLKDKQAGENKMAGTGFLFLIIFFLLILSSISLILLFLYNVLVRREESVNEAWAHVAVFYQRKIDLIPALLEAVKNSAHHEKETLESVTRLRGQVQDMMDDNEDQEKELATLKQSDNALHEELTKVRALAERYPDLKTSMNYLTIQQQLKETEDGVAGARQSYNSHVKHYNAALRLFPLNIMAAVFKFQNRNYYQTDSTI